MFQEFQNGKESNIWWLGRVINVDDPLKSGKLKVNIFNYYDNVDEEYLPWASVSQPINSAALDGLGISPTGIKVGSKVWGFFLDGKSCQIPLICGSISGNDDVSEITQGTSISKKGLTDEPSSQAKIVYPHNKTITTASGHVIEIDDSDGAERIHIYHKSGSYFEMNPDGSIVKVSKNNFCCPYRLNWA